MSQHDEARKLYRMAEAERRRRLSLGRRLDEALRNAARIPGPSAGNVGREAKSAEDDIAPRETRGLMYAPGLESVGDYFEWRLRTLVENLEREVDAHRVKPVFGSAADETTEDRDERLKEYVGRGLSPRDILLIDPAQGSIPAIVSAVKRLKLSV